MPLMCLCLRKNLIQGSLALLAKKHSSHRQESTDTTGRVHSSRSALGECFWRCLKHLPLALSVCGSMVLRQKNKNLFFFYRVIRSLSAANVHTISLLFIEIDVPGDDDKIAWSNLRGDKSSVWTMPSLSYSLCLFVSVFVSVSPAFSCSAQVVEASW